MANRVIFNKTTLSIGDTLKVYYKLIEKEKVSGKAKREFKEEIRERTQIFEGILMSIKGVMDNKSILIRREAVGNIGVERIIPLTSPWIKKITVSRHAKVRRAKLYYLRGQVGRNKTQLKEIKKTKKEMTDDKTSTEDKPLIKNLPQKASSNESDKQS